MNFQGNKKYVTNYCNITKNLKNLKLTYGTWSIKLKRIFITLERYIEFLKKSLKFFYKQFLFKITIKKIRSKKSLESRMGGGKGKNFYNFFLFQCGNIFLEYYNIYIYIILYIFKLITFNKKNNFKFLKKRYI